jgi:hypothetical protein
LFIWIPGTILIGGLFGAIAGIVRGGRKGT